MATRAALALVFHQAHVLLVRRKNPPDAGLWGYPGGHVNPGETTGAAAVRELREETGVEAQDAGLQEVLEVRQEGFAFDLYVHACLFIHGDPVAADDVTDVRWVPVEAVLDGMLPKSRDVDNVLRRFLDAGGA